MAVKTITIVDGVVNTRSADLVGVGESVTTSDTFVIDAKGETRNLLIFVEEQGTGAATVTFDAGDNPPSMLAELGDVDIVLAQADLRYVPLEPGQCIQSDGTITGSVATNTVKVYAIRDPREK
jgi:hypothetical protein